ncbi:hypothetical protein LTR56_019208 [Elasticomyces elasticus]|nr:hypothetical protein LTR56_019208 [Elasticomyces elasticus]KAK3633216.1 hypothetical protein LTR22_020216 [Elasticomyces elasticus]KAK4910625.1 hypothetical protein LTR49_020757 [Elasticomyces elasticus]KAK5751036.1 hypothetical protein LTS12_018937 [Elasticomyces elasticus]
MGQSVPTPSSSLSNTTAHAALNVVELLESIILYLPMREMQRARKVCKQWCQTIDGSPLIKKALFLEPGTVKDLARGTVSLPMTDKAKRFLGVEATNNVTRYATHPFWHPPNYSAAVASEHWIPTLEQQARIIGPAFLMQPPGLTRDAVVECGWHGRVKLDANETFGNLFRKVQRECVSKGWGEREVEGYYRFAAKWGESGY